jgi:hypothetical protein
MCTNNLSSFKIRKVSHFPVLSHGLSLNTITNTLTQALQNVNKQKKNIQCCQLKFFQCNQRINSVPKFLGVSIILSTPCIFFLCPLHTTTMNIWNWKENVLQTWYEITWSVSINENQEVTKLEFHYFLVRTRLDSMQIFKLVGAHLF